MEPIEVCMLGKYTLRAGDTVLRESGNRSRRIFSLLSFLICHWGHPVSRYKRIGDLSGLWAVVSGLSLCGMALVNKKRKEEE